MGGPGRLALVERFVNTELTAPEELGDWLAEHGLADADAIWADADLGRALELREALRALLLANNGVALDRGAVAGFGRDAPLAVGVDATGRARRAAGRGCRPQGRGPPGAARLRHRRAARAAPRDRGRGAGRRDLDAPEGVRCRGLPLGVLRQLAQPVAHVVLDAGLRHPGQGPRLPRAPLVRVPAARLRPLEQVGDGAEAVRDPVLAARPHQQDVGLLERRAAVGAAMHQLVGAGVRAFGKRLPERAPDRPGHDVLEPAEHGAPAARHLVRAEAVAELDVRAAPGAAVVHALPSGSRNWRSPIASTTGSPPRAAIVSGSSGSRVGKSTVATLRPPPARASASTTSARCTTVPIGASSSPNSPSTASAEAGGLRISGSGAGGAPAGSGTGRPSAMTSRPAALSSISVGAPGPRSS